MQVKSTYDIKPTQLHALVYGQSGAGKTYLATTLKNALVISMESGLLTLKDHKIDYVEAKNLEELKAKLSEASKSSYDTIFIDSLTEISQQMVAHAKKIYPNDNQVMKVYGMHNDMITSMIKYTRDMNKNVIYTALEKVEKDNTGRRYHVPDLAGSIATKCPALFDFVFNLQVLEVDQKEVRTILTAKRENFICKSRTNNLNDFEPAHLGDIINKAFKKGEKNV
jgi:ABC-type dipeptide/oligopeptide/nickel transport system ATPase component